MLAAIAANRPLSMLLPAGLIALFALLTVLVWTRFGQARPISKCVVLSLLAHLLLLIYMYSTHILYGPPGRWTGQTVTMRIRDAADDVEAATVASPSPTPWEQPGESNAPLLLATPENKDEKPPKESSPQVAAEPPTVPESKSQPMPQLRDQPKLTDLLPDAESRGSLRATDAVASVPEPPSTQEPETPDPPQSLAADPTSAPPMLAEQNQFVAVTPPPAPRRLGDGLEVPAPLTARVAADRLKAAQPFGATAQTEAAVAAALDWLAKNQSRDGRWDADAHGAGREAR
ncbi:MAG: hypothetical protein JF612_04260, partial [Planctomycetia bacterium]|nr:hypothetical protein [Planctomycetia bacterium]